MPEYNESDKPVCTSAHPSHPAGWIRGSKSTSLSGKTIVLGVTGSIAAVRVVELARELIRHGADVHAVMTASAAHILHPDALVYATGNPVVSDISGNVEHVSFFGAKGCADLFLIAPATANTISKIAAGIDDTPVTTFATTAVGEGRKIIVVPAMHESMFDHPQVRRNLETLSSFGIDVIGPDIREGVAKIVSNDTIVTAVRRTLAKPGPLSGKRVFVTSGATAEKIDPIRILTNRASGKTGEALALDAWRRGADVFLFRRNETPLPVPSGVSTFCDIRVESAADMTNAVLSRFSGNAGALKPDILIGAAAVSDYTATAGDSKIRSGEAFSLDLRPTPKLIKAARQADRDLLIVAFKAETEPDEDRLIETASKKIVEYDADMIVANNVTSGGMGTDDNRVWLIRRDASGRVNPAEISCVSGPKPLIAQAVLDGVESLVDVRSLRASENAYGRDDDSEDEGIDLDISFIVSDDVSGPAAVSDTEPGTDVSDTEPGTDVSDTEPENVRTGESDAGIGACPKKYYEMGGGGTISLPASKRRRKPLKMQGRTFIQSPPKTE